MYYPSHQHNGNHHYSPYHQANGSRVPPCPPHLHSKRTSRRNKKPPFWQVRLARILLYGALSAACAGSSALGCVSIGRYFLIDSGSTPSKKKSKSLAQKPRARQLPRQSIMLHSLSYPTPIIISDALPHYGVITDCIPLKSGGGLRFKAEPARGSFATALYSHEVDWIQKKPTVFGLPEKFPGSTTLHGIPVSPCKPCARERTSWQDAGCEEY